MKTLFKVLVLALSSVCFAGESVVGIFAPQKLGSRLELTAAGDFSLESVDDPKIWFAGGRWKKEGKTVRSRSALQTTMGLRPIVSDLNR